MPTTVIRPVTDTPAASPAGISRGPAQRRATEPGEEVEVGVGGDLDPSPSRRLTVAQLQQALRRAYAANADIVPTGLPGDGPCRIAVRDGAAPSLPCDGTWLAVVPAHPGAGASIVALALADAAADAQTATGLVHLIEWADPDRCGLAAATDTELGVDATGAWRVGRRGTVALYRRAAVPESDAARPWPAMLNSPEDGSTDRVVVLDLSGMGDAGEAVVRLAGQVQVTVLVTHSSVPGLRAVDRLIEHWLTADTDPDAPARTGLLDGPVMIVVAVGPRRWPGAVTASLTPRLAELRRAGRVVPVPVDAGLWVTGASSTPLPSRVRAAARKALTLLPHDPSRGAPVASPAPDDAANRISGRGDDGLDALFDLSAEDRR